MNRTPRRPKYSLMTSVITNTIGHSSTPAVKLSEPDWPNRFQPNGGSPSVGSSAKIFTPTNSAMMALAAKNAASTMNSRVDREASECAHAAGFRVRRGRRSIHAQPSRRDRSAELRHSLGASAPAAGRAARACRAAAADRRRQPVELPRVRPRRLALGRLLVMRARASVAGPRRTGMPVTSTSKRSALAGDAQRSPTRTCREALTRSPLTCTCPPSTASCARLRLLKKRAHQSHLSIRRLGGAGGRGFAGDVGSRGGL